MLAYVFWHIPAEDVDAAEYESRLVEFHRTLAVHPPAGFNSSIVWKHPVLPWAPASLAVYEDWYEVDDFATLGLLNDAAVSGPVKASHDRVASMSDWGAGGVYRRRDGSGQTRLAAFIYSSSKPSGWSYDRFFATLAEREKIGVWQRQMVLGPAPEFCIFSRDPLELGMPGVQLSAPTLVWPHDRSAG